jgi:hypothetical protein
MSFQTYYIYVTMVQSKLAAQNKEQINGTESKKILVVLCLHVLSNGALRYTVNKTSHCPLPCPASPSPSP